MTENPQSMATLSDWSLSVWTHPFSIYCALLGLFAIGGIVACLSAFRRMPKLSRVTLLRDQQGTATIEFAMVMPFLLFLSLTLAQVTLALGGNVVVHYASFAAARAAIVQIPRDLADVNEPHNVVDVDNGDKMAFIRRAAVWAVLPAAGRSEDGEIETEEFVTGLTEHYAAYDRDQPPWVTNLAADRLRYADFNTDVVLQLTISREDEPVTFIDLPDGRHEFGPKEPITVQVYHYLNLAVPYVWPMFSDTLDAPEVLLDPRCTLTIEGTNTELPLRPTSPPDFNTIMERHPQDGSNE